MKFNFYFTLQKIVNGVNSRANKERIYKKKAKWLDIIFMPVILAIPILVTLKPMLETDESYFAPFGMFFPPIALVLIGSKLVDLVKKKDRTDTFEQTLITIGFILAGIVVFFAMVYPAIAVNSMYLLSYYIGMACFLIIARIHSTLEIRNDYGKAVLGHILGFRDFLMLAEKPQLEMLVEEDPSYFYRILPYTYVLGVSDIWIRKFADIAIEPPQWWNSSMAFSLATLAHSLEATVSTAKTMMTAEPANIGRVIAGGLGSGNTGGGSAGGGSGGGGGGVW